MAAKRIFKVVVNHEEQYSIWPADRENAKGFRDEGTTGTEAECQARIDQLTARRR
jgi:MbtH protein